MNNKFFKSTITGGSNIFQDNKNLFRKISPAKIKGVMSHNRLHVRAGSVDKNQQQQTVDSLIRRSPNYRIRARSKDDTMNQPIADVQIEEEKSHLSPTKHLPFNSEYISVKLFELSPEKSPVIYKKNYLTNDPFDLNEQNSGINNDNSEKKDPCLISGSNFRKLATGSSPVKFKKKIATLVKNTNPGIRWRNDIYDNQANLETQQQIPVKKIE